MKNSFWGGFFYTFTTIILLGLTIGWVTVEAGDRVILMGSGGGSTFTGALTGNLEVTGNAHVTGTTQLDSDTHINGSLDVDSNLNVDGAVQIDGMTTASGGLVVGETVGADILLVGHFNSSADWTAGAGWTIGVTGVATHGAGTGTLAPAVAVPAVVGTPYLVTYTASSWTVAGTAITWGGSTVQEYTLPNADGTYTQRVVAISTASLVLTPVTGGRFALDNITVKPITSTVSTSAGPLTVTETFADATASEAAMTISGTQTGAGGDKTLLELDYTGTLGTGTEYLINGKGKTGTSVFSVKETGVLAAGGFTNLTNSSIINSTATSSVAFYSASAYGNAPIAVFTYAGTPAAHTNATNTLSVFSAAPVLSAAHSAGAYTAFNAADLHVNGSTLAPTALKVGTGYDYALDAASGLVRISDSPIASESALHLNGTVFTGGSATTTKPHLLVEPSGTTSTGWSTSGTLIGANAASGFTGPLLDLQVNGVSKLRVAETGWVYSPSATFSSFIYTPTVTQAAANSILNVGGGAQSTAGTYSVNMAYSLHTQSAGNNVAVRIVPTYNQTATAAATDLLINRTSTATGSGAQLSIDVRDDNTSVARMTATGATTVQALTVGDTLGAETAVQTADNWDETGATTATEGPLVFTRTASGSDLVLSHTPTVTAAKWYKVVYTLGGSVAGTIQTSVGGTSNTARTMAAGTYTEYLYTVATTSLRFTFVAATAGTISGISCKQVTEETTSGNVRIAGNLTGNGPIYGSMHIDGTTGVTEALTGTTPVQIVDAEFDCGPLTATHVTCTADSGNLDIVTAGTYDIGFNMSFAVSTGTEVMTCAVYKEGTALEEVAFHRTAAATYGVAGARSIVAVAANDTLTVKCNIADASTPNLLIEHMQVTAIRLGD